MIEQFDTYRVIENKVYETCQKRKRKYQGKTEERKLGLARCELRVVY